MVTPLQKCYDEISILKEELKKRDEQIEKLIENNINLNKKVESLLYKFPKQKLLTPPRSKVAKFVENYEKNIVKPIPKPRPALRSKVAKFVENYEKNIVKPIPKPRPIKTPPIPKPRTIKTPPIPKPRTIKTPPIIPEEMVKTPPIVKEIPKPSDYMFIDEDKPEMIKSAFKKSQKRFKINTTHIHSPVDEMKSKKNVIENLLKDNLKSMKSLKFNYGLEITFTQLSKEDQTRIAEIKEILWSSPQIIINENDIDKKMDLVISDIMQRITSFSATGTSALVISKINSQYIDIIQYKPLKGSSYIELPKELKNPKMGLINIKNEDQKCFTYCLLYHLHQNKIKSNPQRVSNYKQYENTVDFTGINFPVSIKDIPKIEKMNNIAINVFGYENKTTFPVFISDTQTENPLNLLLISNYNKRHYIYTKDFNRFMYKNTKHHCKKHFCIYCLQCFSTEAILNNHLENCLIINKKQNIIMPKFGSKIFFKNYFKMIKSPFVIYCDFESILEPIDVAKQDEKTTSYTTGYQNHLISSYAYKVVCQLDKYTKPIKSYRGENATKDFLTNLLIENQEIQEIIKTQFQEKMKITNEQQNEFQRTTICHICNGKLTKKDKVHDHCHVTGEYRGAAQKL